MDLNMNMNIIYIYIYARIYVYMKCNASHLGKCTHEMLSFPKRNESNRYIYIYCDWLQEIGQITTRYEMYTKYNYIYLRCK